MRFLFYFKNNIGKNQHKFRKIWGSLIILGSVVLFSGCEWVLIGTGAAVGYKVITDPRSVGTQIDDAKITTKIKLKFLEDKEIKAFSIDVDTVNGVVTLTGMVETEEQRRRAVEIAKSVTGVKAVVNNIQVKKR